MKGGRKAAEDQPGFLSGRRVYEGRILNIDVDRVRFPDGSEGELEMVRHPGAAAVLPLYRTGEWDGGAGPAVILLRQYRYATDGWVWEAPAGKLDAGESPRSCALRELEEEAGVRAGRVAELTTIWTTPGFTDERIHLFVATQLREGRPAHQQQEFIERHELPFAEALEMVREGIIQDSKTVCLILHTAAFHDHGDVA